MTFVVRQIACALVVSALAVPVSLARAAAGDGTPVAVTPGIRASIDRAVDAGAPLTSRLASSPAFLAPAFPVAPKRDRSLKQMGGGGGGGMMVMGIIGTLAGLAGTYYRVKMMKDQQKDEAAKTAQ